MKKQALFLCCIILSSFQPALAQEAAVESPVSFLGDFCWNFRVDGATVGSGRLGVTQAGTHYILTGTVRADKVTRPVQGSAEKSGDRTLIVLNSAHTDQYATSATQISMTLKGTTFSVGGKFAAISHDYNYSVQAFEPTAHRSGTLVPVACK
jgi:hypothetical protein